MAAHTVELVAGFTWVRATLPLTLPPRVAEAFARVRADPSLAEELLSPLLTGVFCPENAPELEGWLVTYADVPAAEIRVHEALWSDAPTPALKASLSFTLELTRPLGEDELEALEEDHDVYLVDCVSLGWRFAPEDGWLTDHEGSCLDVAE